MRIAFVCAFLGEHGGLENEVQAVAEVALEAGHQISIYTPHLAVDSAVGRNLAGRCRFYSAQQSWRQTWRGRSLYSAARIKHFLLKRKKPTSAEDTHLA